jgi:hypothetical protein
VSDGSVAAIGPRLAHHVQPAFELISVVLLVAILGALVIARGGRTKANEPAPKLHEQPAVYLVLAAFLLAIGIYGLIRRRTLIGMLIAGELIFSAASLNFMAANRFFAPDPASARSSSSSSWASPRPRWPSP